MIEKLKLRGPLVDYRDNIQQIADRVDELIEASNRQDRVIAYLLTESTGYQNAKEGTLGKETFEFYQDYFRNHVGKLNG